MSTNEKVAHKRNLHRKRKQKWREERKTALSIVPPENLPLYKGHRLGKVVRAVFEENSKARKRAKKQYGKILKNPRLLAEKNTRIHGENVCTGLTRGCLTVGKIRNLMKPGFFEAARL